MHSSEIYELADRIGYEDPLVQKYLWQADHGYEQSALRGLRNHARQTGFDPDTPREPYESWGDLDNLCLGNGIEMGREHYSQLSVFIGHEEMIRGGILILGSTGSGKTTLGFHILRELLNNDCHHPRHCTP